METLPVDLSGTAARGPVLETALRLTAPTSRLRVKLPPGPAGRAEAVIPDPAAIRPETWAAKHYWSEGNDTIVYEFDQPLPEGEILLRIPRA
jgi:hypothetical protein